MLFNDTLTNLVTGMGTDKDKIQASQFTERLFTQYELMAMYDNDWLAGKIVDAPVDDMTREWRAWDGPSAMVKKMVAAERTLHVQSKMNRAQKLGRLSGGAILIMGFGDKDPSLPIDVTKLKRGCLKYLQVFSRWEAFAGPIDRDVMSPTYGKPKYYELSNQAGRVQVHPSRCVRFIGRSVLNEGSSIDGWGMSILQRVYDSVRNATFANSNLASLTAEAKVDVFGVPGLTSRVSDPDYRAAMLQRFYLVNVSKSVNNAVLRDSLETWEQKKISFAHFPEVSRLFLEICAAASDIPATRLLSTSPKGMNATGASDSRNYYDMLASQQEVDTRPAITPLDQALVAHIGANPDNMQYEWNSLWQMTEAEQAAIDLQIAQTAQIYASMGALPPSAMAGAVQAKLLEENTYPGLAGLLDAAKAAGETNAPLVAPTAAVDKPSSNAKVAPAG